MPAKDLKVQIAGDETQLDRALERSEGRLTRYTAAVERQSAVQAGAFRKVGEQSAWAAGQAGAFAGAHENASRRVAASSSMMLREHGAAMQKMGDRTMAAGRAVSSVGSSFLSVVAPIDAAGFAAGKLAVDFNRAMELLHTQANYSQRDVEKLSKAVLELSPKVGASPKELAEGLYHVASAGFDASKAMEITKEAMIGARLGFASADETAYALVSLLKTAPKDIKSASDAMGLMNSVVGQGDMRMQQLVDALSTGIVPAARAAGLGFRDVGAALDILTARGMPAQMSGTRLRQTFAFLEKQSKSAQKALDEIGISQGTLGADLQKPNGLLVAVERLKTHLEGSGKSAAEQNRVLLTAFGGGRSSAAIQTLVQNVGELRKRYDTLPEAAGAVKHLNDVWHDFQQTPAQQIAETQQKINVSLIEFGNQILPTALPIIKELGSTIGVLAHDFDNLSSGQKKTIIDVTLAATALGLLSKPIGGIITTVGFVGRSFGLAETAASKFVGVFGTTLAETVPLAAREGTLAGSAYSTAFAAAAGRGPAVGALAGTASPRYAPYMVPGGTSRVPGFGPRAGVPGLGPAGYTAVEQAAISRYGYAGGPLPSEIFTAANAPGITSRIASGARTLGGNALRGGFVGLTGFAAGEIAGAAIPGHAGNVARGIIIDASVGAAIGTAIAPGLGTAVGGGLGAIAGALKQLGGGTQGQHVAETAGKGTNVGKTFGSEIDASNRTAGKAIWKLEHPTPNFSEEAGHFLHGISGGIISEGVKDKLAPWQLQERERLKAQQQAEQFAAGKRFGGGHFHEEMKATAGFSQQAQLTGLITDTEKRFKDMPAAARAGAFASIMAMVKVYQEKGKLPPTAVEEMTRQIEKKWPALAYSAGRAGTDSVSALNRALKGQHTLTGVESLVNNWRNIFPQLPHIVGLNLGNAQQTIEKVNATLAQLAHSGPESQRAAYAEIYKKIRDEERKYFHEGRVGIEAEVHDLTKEMKTKGPATLQPLLTAYSRLRQNIEASMAAGVTATKAGTDKIRAVLVKEMKAIGLGGPTTMPGLEQERHSNKFGPSPTGSANPLQETGVGSSGFYGAEPRARGSWIGQPGERGHDEVLISAGRGEAVVNHHQQPYVEMGLATSKALGMQPYGSLGELFSHVNTPHYMATGGFTPGQAYPAPMSRIDQGVDFTGVGPFRAVLDGTVLSTGLWPGWPGTGGVVYSTPRGNVYVMEHVTTSVHKGQQVHAGDVLGQELPGSPWLETGWANAAGTGPLTPYNGHADGTAMPGGKSFASFLGGGAGYGVGATAGKMAHAIAAPHVALPGLIGKVAQAAVNQYTKAANHKLGFEDGGFITAMAGGGHVNLQKKFAPVTQMLSKLWKAAAPFYHQGGRPMRQPTYTTGPDGMFVGVDQSSHTRPGHRNLYIPDWIVQGEGGPGLAAKAPDMLQLMLHEWAHEYQNLGALAKADQRVPRSLSKVGSVAAEGGAQAFAQRVGPRILAAAGLGGVHPHNDMKGDLYYNATRWVEGNLGDKWIRDGQFGYAGGGFVSTAYGPPWEGIEGTGTTSTGIDLHKHGKGDYPHKYIVAVDPNVIPLGSELKVWPNPFGHTGNFLAADTGGAIKGNRLDFYDWRGRSLQNAWGRRNVTVTVGGTVTGGKTKKAAAGLTLTPRQAEHEKHGIVAAEDLKGERLTRGDWATESAGALETHQARWNATPRDLVSAAGAHGATLDAEQVVKSDKDQLRFYGEELKMLQREAKVWGGLRDYFRKIARGKHGLAKKQALDKAASYAAKVRTAEKDAKTLKGTIYSAETKLIEAETAEHALPGEIAAAQVQHTQDVQSGDMNAYQAALGHIDLEERAGMLSPEKAKAAREQVANRALAGGFGELSSDDILKIKGDLLEFSKATQEATAAQEAHTQALKDATKVLVEFMHASEGITKVENTTLVKAIADLISGQIGGSDYHSRAAVPGTGEAARY